MALNENYILEDSDALGSFGFITYTVSLKAKDRSFLMGLRNKEDLATFEESLTTYSTAIHEYRHYYDMTHTTYGIEYFYNLDQALRQRFKQENGDEYHFHKIKKFANELKKIRYPSYYNQLWQDDDSKKWDLIPSIGKVFDSYGNVSDRPILFARYFNAQGESLARHPFSMVSLLECSATIDEYINSMGNIVGLLKDDETQRNFLATRFKQNSLDYIYNIYLTEYSTCFHLIANHFRIENLDDLFDIARVLLDICLNFTEKHFDLFNDSNVVDKLFKPSEGFTTEQLNDYIYFNASLKNGLKFLERPILFYVLLQLMEKKKFENKQEVIQEIDRILSSCGLSCKSIIIDARKLVKDKANLIIHSDINYFAKISQTIGSNLDRISRAENIDSGFNFFLKFIQHLDLPLLEMESGFEILLPRDGNILAEVNYPQETKAILLLKNWVDQYDDACIF